MLQQQIYSALRERFAASPLLAGVGFYSFKQQENLSGAEDAVTQSYIHFDVHGVTESTATLTLTIESSYQGLLETSLLHNEVRDCIRSAPFTVEGRPLAFKEMLKAGKGNVLTYAVKRF